LVSFHATDETWKLLLPVLEWIVRITQRSDRYPLGYSFKIFDLKFILALTTLPEYENSQLSAQSAGWKNLPNLATNNAASASVNLRAKLI